MEINDLDNLVYANDVNVMEIVKKGSTGELSLYTIIKTDICVHYDYCEMTDTQDGQDRILGVGEKDTTVKFSRGEIYKLPMLCLEELALHHQLKQNQLYLVFQNDESSLRFNSVSKHYDIGIKDLYVNSKDLKKTKSKSSTRRKKPYLQAINLALTELGVEAETKDIYSWIRTQASDFNSADNCFNDIDCEGDNLLTYGDAKEKEFVLLNDGKPVDKELFGQSCSRAKKKMK